MAKPTTTFRATDTAQKLIDETMKKENMNKSEAINYLILKSQDGNCHPYYRQTFAKLAMDLSDALNQIEDKENVKYVDKVLEGFKCQIL